jgi:photosystem II stability/assembly factor-like uncharacterized protein
MFARYAKHAVIYSVTLFTSLAAATTIAAQTSERDPNEVYNPALFDGMEYRMVGPYRGGRSTAVAGIPDRPHVFFQGTTGGGVWQTKDAGQTWANVSDGYFGGSIGAVAVAQSDPNVIYVGTGSACIRGNTSTGRGAYKSDDGGKSWKFIGLRETGQIGSIAVHPANAGLVYVAALGHPFGKNPERGVYRSSDGGATWENVLFLNDSTGAVDLALNPGNPREIYAGIWRAERNPWTLISGALEGGVYKSRDGGDTWEKLAGGLPDGMVGKVGVTVSPANTDRVWALIEAEPDGGVYRSDDGGETWQRVNSENKLRQRAWYYTHLMADPKDEHTVYALNTGMYRSVDGGETFESIPVPHGDVHDLWINPHDPHTMIVADDGGAQVSVTGGASWSSYYNQPTAELYDVVVDNAFPYRLYGAQQDNTTISIPAWTSSNTLHAKEHWDFPGGCETGPVALHPDHPSVIYAGCYGGNIDRYDLNLDQRRNVLLYPQAQAGDAAKNLRYRFQWVSPMVVSPHDPNVVYHASQFVHRSRDGGMTWRTLSPDLTTNTAAHQDFAGGPINHDITGVEIYNTVFSLAVSPHTPDVIWAGSDDGRVHMSRDGGGNWTDVTPRDMPQYGTVDGIDISPHQPGQALVAVQRYRLDDFAPYIFRTRDYGESWDLITDGENGIPGDYFVRAVREDPDRAGLLYAGTEFGMFVSFNDGRNWQSLQLNLPVTPITGMEVRHKDLVLSTQGRSFWVLDDVTPLHQLVNQLAEAAVHLYQPRDAFRMNVAGASGETAPERLAGNAFIHFYLAQEPTMAVSLEILDAGGTVARRFISDTAAARKNREQTLNADAGMNRVAWDIMYQGPETPEGVVVWGFNGGVKAPPGTYQARLTVGGDVQTRSFEVMKDPRLTEVTQADFDAQFDLAIAIRDTLTHIYTAIEHIRSVKEQAHSLAQRANDAGRGEELIELADSLAARLGAIEQKLTQVKNQSNQDPLRFAPMLDNQFVAVYEYVTGVDAYRYGGAEGRPTEGAYARFQDLNAEWTALQTELHTIMMSQIQPFNDAVERLGLTGIVMPMMER